MELSIAVVCLALSMLCCTAILVIDLKGIRNKLGDIHKLVEQEANRSQAIRHSSKEIVKALREKAPRNW